MNSKVSVSIAETAAAIIEAINVLIIFRTELRKLSINFYVNINGKNCVRKSIPSYRAE